MNWLFRICDMKCVKGTIKLDFIIELVVKNVLARIQTFYKMLLKMF